MGQATGALAALALIAAVGIFGGLVDLFLPYDVSPDATTQAPAVTGKALSGGQPDVVALFSHPLPYAATVTQSGNGIDEPRTRFYIPKSVKEAK